jgi:hypothetical protein
VLEYIITEKHNSACSLVNFEGILLFQSKLDYKQPRRSKLKSSLSQVDILGTQPWNSATDGSLRELVKHEQLILGLIGRKKKVLIFSHGHEATRDRSVNRQSTILFFRTTTTNYDDV